MSNTFSNPESSAVSGGKIWKPTPLKNNTVWKAAQITFFTMLAIILVITVISIVQASTPPTQNKDFFLAYTPLSQGWEKFILYPALAIFFISSCIILSSAELAGILLAISLTGSLCVVSMIGSVVNNEVQANDLSEWLQEDQGLTPLTTPTTLSKLKTNSPVLMQNSDNEIYSVIFKYSEDKLSIVSKTELEEVNK